MKFMKHLPCNERQSENARLKKKKSNEEDLKMQCRNNYCDRTINYCWRKTFQKGHLGSVKQFLWAAANQIQKRRLFSLSHIL